MADRWVLINSTGVRYELNPTFSAPQYEAGSIDTDAARRWDGARAWQRSGDGLRTPGPFTLTGFVWNDPRDPSAAWTELDAIQAAVDFCTRVERRDSRTISIYEDLAGGPTIEVLPDGAGGYAVTIRLWPSRAEATVVPYEGHLAPLAFAAGVDEVGNDKVTLDFESAPQPGDLEVLFCFASSTTSLVNIETPAGWAGGRVGLGSVAAKGFCFWRLAPNGALHTLDLTTEWISRVSWAYGRYLGAPTNALVEMQGALSASTPPVTNIPEGGATWVGFWYYARGGVDAPDWLPPPNGTARAASHAGAAPWYSPFIADGMSGQSIPPLTADPQQITGSGTQHFAAIAVFRSVDSA